MNSLVGRNQHIACFAHLVNLITEKPLTELNKISDIITRVRNIVKWIKNSVNASDSLRNKQRQNNVKEGNLKKMILDVKTRRNSCYYMLERFVELSAIVSKILFGKRDAPTMLNGDELSIIKELMIVLQPLEFMTKEISGEAYVTSSRVIPMINCAMHNYTKTMTLESTEAISLKECITAEIRKICGSMEFVKPFAFATILDTRFKNLHFQNPEASAINPIRQMLKTPHLTETELMNSDKDSLHSGTESYNF